MAVTGRKKPVEDAAKSASTMDALVRSHEIARRVLPALTRLGLPASPTNYRLWYEYHSGGPDGLKETIDRLIKDKTPITADLAESLYTRFFSLEAAESHSHLLQYSSRQVQTAALEIIKNLLISIAQSGEYGESLGKHLEGIRRADDLESVREIVMLLIRETGCVLESQDAFQRRMEETASELSELQEALRKKDELAHTDELTGLHNRRAFNCRMAEETARSQRYGTTVSLIMFDLDDFKRVNDRYGHLVGDRVLATTAAEIRRAIRGPDFAARYGGEEFAVICPQTDLKGSCLVAERLRQALDRTEFKVREENIRVTISAGVALLRVGESDRQWIDRADRALYLAKEKGKNRVLTELDFEEKK